MRVITIWGNMERVVWKNHREINKKWICSFFLYKINNLIFLLTILREKWPVGSKAKFKILADRVGTDHTYLAVPCGAVKIDALDDLASLKEAETQQLAATLVFYRANRKRFANSSAVQGLIKQA